MTTPTVLSEAAQRFRAARDLLLERRLDYDAALRDFEWPRLEEFNWALDHVDAVATDPATADRPALWIVEQDGSEAKYTFADMRERSNRVANWLRERGVGRGDRIILMLANQVELWESILGAMKLGAVIIPSTPMLGAADLRDRIDRGRARHVVVRDSDVEKFADVPGDYTRISVGPSRPEGWIDYAGAYGASAEFTPEGVTRGDDTLLLYFTSGTTAKPKLVEHTHTSYPVGHLSTMYWIGLQPGDVHLNVASPGWAKHAWSNVFAPWIAEATILIVNYAKFDADALLDQMVDKGVSTFCAPPTVWRMLIQADLTRVKVPMRELLGAGEPLNPEVIEQVREAWGMTVRDGFGQTESTLQIGNTPGQTVKDGAMGRPVPGYPIVLVDPVSGEHGDEGEICVDLRGDGADRPLGLMVGYKDDPERNDEVMRGGVYHTGDVASRDGNGYITYVGRSDDVFKASDYRISPFELESVLIEHDAVAEAAVVPSPDPLRLAVPKAYVVLSSRWEPTRETALAILRHAREQLPAYKRVRRLEFFELPKTISGKIRRVELRTRESDLRADPAGGAAPEDEYRDEDFPELRA